MGLLKFPSTAFDDTHPPKDDNLGFRPPPMLIQKKYLGTYNIKTV